MLLLLIIFRPESAFPQAPPSRESPIREPSIETPPGPRESPLREPSLETPPLPPPLTIPSVTRPVPTTITPAIGPPTTFRLLPSVSVAEEYTDNFNLSRQNRQKNFRSILAPAVDLVINGAFTTGSLSYSPSVIYDSSIADVSLFHALSGQVTWKATPRLTLSASDALIRSDEAAQADNLHLRHERRKFTSNIFSLVSDYLVGAIRTREHYLLATFIDEGGNDTMSHTVGADVIVPVYEANSAVVGYEYLTSETSDGSNISGHQFTGSLMRRLTPLTSAGVAGGYAFRSVTNIGPIDYQVWNAAFQGTYDLPNRWTLNSSIGAGALSSDERNRGPLLTTLTSLIYRLARGTATVSIDRGFSETFATGQNFGVVQTQGATAALSYSVTPATVGTVAAFYRQNKFAGIGGGAANENADVWGGSMFFSIQVRRWLRLDVGYTHTEQVAVPRQNTYTENRARVALSLQFY